MKLKNLDTPSKVVFYVHRYSRNFRPNQPGSAVGVEYEDYLRAALASNLPLDLISSCHDLGMGQGLSSRSGLKHELDLIVRSHSFYFVFELKHYAQSYVTKDMLLVFNQKVLDFYLPKFGPN